MIIRHDNIGLGAKKVRVLGLWTKTNLPMTVSYGTLNSYYIDPFTIVHTDNGFYMFGDDGRGAFPYPAQDVVASPMAINTPIISRGQQFFVSIHADCAIIIVHTGGSSPANYDVYGTGDLDDFGAGGTFHGFVKFTSFTLPYLIYKIDTASRFTLINCTNGSFYFIGDSVSLLGWFGYNKTATPLEMTAAMIGSGVDDLYCGDDSIFGLVYDDIKMPRSLYVWGRHRGLGNVGANKIPINLADYVVDGITYNFGFSGRSYFSGYNCCYSTSNGQGASISYVAGLNSSGQLGVGISNQVYTTQANSILRIPPSNQYGSIARNVSISSTSLFFKSGFASNAYFYGSADNRYGSLGNGTTVSTTNGPILLPEIPVDATVIAGLYNSFYIKNGKLMSCGRGDRGGHGLGTLENIYSWTEVEFPV